MENVKIWLVVSGCFEDDLECDRIPNHICLDESKALRYAYLMVKDQIQIIKEDHQDLLGDSFNQMVSSVSGLAQRKNYYELLNIYNKYICDNKMLDNYCLINVYSKYVE